MPASRLPPHLDALVRADGGVTLPPEWVHAALTGLVAGAAGLSRRDASPVAPVVHDMLAVLAEADRRVREEPPAFASESHEEPAATLSGMTISVGEAAAQLECSPQYVRLLLRSGQVDGRRAGRPWLVDAASLEDFRHRQGAA